MGTSKVWYVEKWLGDMFVSRAPHPMEKWEAEQLANMAKYTPSLLPFDFKVVHRNNLHA